MEDQFRRSYARGQWSLCLDKRHIDLRSAYNVLSGGPICLAISMGLFYHGWIYAEHTCESYYAKIKYDPSSD